MHRGDAPKELGWGGRGGEGHIPPTFILGGDHGEIKTVASPSVHAHRLMTRKAFPPHILQNTN